MFLIHLRFKRNENKKLARYNANNHDQISFTNHEGCEVLAVSDHNNILGVISQVEDISRPYPYPLGDILVSKKLKTKQDRKEITATFHQFAATVTSLKVLDPSLYFRVYELKLFETHIYS